MPLKTADAWELLIGLDYRARLDVITMADQKSLTGMFDGRCSLEGVFTLERAVLRISALGVAILCVDYATRA